MYAYSFHAHCYHIMNYIDIVNNPYYMVLCISKNLIEFKKFSRSTFPSSNPHYCAFFVCGKGLKSYIICKNQAVQRHPYKKTKKHDISKVQYHIFLHPSMQRRDQSSMAPLGFRRSKTCTGESLKQTRQL